MRARRQRFSPFPLGLLLVFVSPASLWGQPAFGGGRVSAWGPDVLSAEVEFATRAFWRGFDFGTHSFRGSADVSLYGHPVTASRHPTPWGVSIRGEALGVGTGYDDAPTGSRLEGTLVLSRLVGSADTAVEVLATGYHGPDDVGDASGFEVGLGIRSVRLPLFAEPDVMVAGRLLRDFGRFDGTHAEAAVAVELNPPQFGQRLELEIGARAFANDYFDDPFGLQAGQLELGIDVLISMVAHRSLTLITGGVLHRARASDFEAGGLVGFRLM